MFHCRHASGNDGSTTDNDVTTGSCGKAEVEDGDIDEYLNTLEQDDPILIEAIKSYYLDRPNTNFDLKVPPKRLQRERIGESSLVCFAQGNLHFLMKRGCLTASCRLLRIFLY